MAENTEAAALKGRRTAVKNTPKTDPAGNVTGSDQPVGVGIDEPARNFFMLGDPDEPRAVIESSGGPYGTILGDDYVIAPEDAVESFVPNGCQTSVTRQLWCRGQHVPIERFHKHYGKEAAAALLAPTATEAVEAAEAAEVAPTVKASEGSTPPAKVAETATA